jgi:protein-S-isoprenylcysteine O-methyltransferase Ste14
VTDPRAESFEAYLFANRGLLLTAPAALLAAFGKPSAFSLAVGLPIAATGELLRCWAVGYSGETTRDNQLAAPVLVTSGPYAYVRNPLYLGNFITALGFTAAFTGKNTFPAKVVLGAAALGAMAALYATIIPHEERYLREKFGDDYDRYCERVPQVLPQLDPAEDGKQQWDPRVVARAESKTFVTFGAMLALLAIKSISA